MENTDAPGVRGEPGERRASGRGRDSPDAHFFFADVASYPHLSEYVMYRFGVSEVSY